jgi:hypothetical protein
VVLIPAVGSFVSSQMTRPAFIKTEDRNAKFSHQIVRNTKAGPTLHASLTGTLQRPTDPVLLFDVNMSQTSRHMDVINSTLALVHRPAEGRRVEIKKQVLPFPYRVYV